MSLSDLKQYEVIEHREIADINSEGTILRHVKTGARVVCLENDDNNKVFYIGFRTPPADSTGVPHIIEHSVLCGSKKYPAKDPFVELAKGSLNTFLNAMTYPDKTVYPVASCNDKDFRNLMDVYLDAVFYPNIYSKEQIFKQEGWHYELDDKDGEVTLNGVVYSEMKGAFSSPEDVLDRVILDSLFPDTCYGVESGGDPDYIPTLTYENFIKFHGQYYHPSNSYIYLYGDMNMEEQLEYIDREYLSKFDRLEIDSEVATQQSFDKPVTVRKEYSITNDEPIEDNTYLSYNVVTNSALDRELYLAFQILEYALLSTPGAVLKQALLDKKICKDVSGGYDNGILQNYFSVVAINSNESSQDEFISTIREFLSDVSKNGIDRKALRAGLNYYEFKFREADFAQYPKGLMYGLQSLDSWLYDDKAPFMHLEPLSIFKYLNEQVDNGYFEKLIDKYLLNNSHSSVVTLVPTRGLTAVKDKELSDKLAQYKAGLSADEIAKLIEETKALHEYQQSEDTEEALASIPLLNIEDIKKEAEEFVYQERKKDDLTFITHDIFTNGIGYLDIAFDITEMPYDLLPYVSILKAVWGTVNTSKHSYADLANEIFLNTGGIAPKTSAISNATDSEKFLHLFEIRAKIFYDKLGFAFDIIREILLESDYTDKKRLYEIICTVKSRLQAGMISSGHSVSAKRALANLTEVGYVGELTGGIEFYRIIEELEDDFENKSDDLIEKLELVSKMIFNKSVLKLFDYTAQSSQYDIFMDKAAEFAGFLPEGEKIKKTDKFEPGKMSEGFKTGAKVQYVAKAGRYLDAQHPYTGALKVLKVIMGYDYLWNQIRVVGGAYGAFASFYKNGDACFASYRDPNLAKTLDTYDSVADYLKNFSAGSRDMTKYIIGTISDLDLPLTPSQKGERSLAAYLAEEKFENIQREREQVLCCTDKDIRNLYSYVERIISEASICVLGGEEMLEKEEKLFDTIEPLFKK